MMLRYLMLFLIVNMTAHFGIAQIVDNNRLIRSGNKAFLEGDTTSAIETYNEALVNDHDDYRASFNKAVVSKSGSKFEEAEALYKSVAERELPVKDRAAAYYNLGNIAFEKQDFEKSLEHFKNCLRLTPQDPDAKYNYFLVKKILEQQEQQQQQNQDQENQDQQEQEEQEQQNQEQSQEENQDQQQQEQQNDQQDGENGEQEQQQSDQGEDQNEQQQQGSSGDQEENGEEEREGQVIKLSPEEAERLLETLENKEKEIQARILEKKPKKSNKSPEKDW